MNNPTANPGALTASLNSLKTHVNKHLIGQPKVVEQVLVAMLAGGHVLIEGVPGLGKTLLVQTLASGIGGKFKRIQFTPDLMPGDVTGHVMFDMAQSKFILKQGPVFTNLLLADEINRAPAKTQAALLEVMQEYQVTLDGRTLEVKKPFMVLATQNPIEQEGTYALPEAQLDRFIIKINIDYPSAADEVLIATQHSAQPTLANDAGQKSLIDITAAQAHCAQIDVDSSVAEYAVNLARETRNTTLLRHGAGPRASIALLKCAKAVAFINGEHFITPDDVKSMALGVLRHRVILAPEVEIDGLHVDDVLRTLLEKVDAPRS
jgi:MoxR-like ATPase